jgi:putative transposase
MALSQQQNRWKCGRFIPVLTPGAAALLEDRQRQRIIAMVCSDPPEGRARWTVRLVAEEAVKRRLVPRVGRETVRVLLLHHDLKPWREKNVVRGRTQ